MGGVQLVNWKDKSVLVTGHTGFKGSWLSLWLKRLGAQVIGYSLAPPTNPNMFEAIGLGQDMDSRIADVRDLKNLRSVIEEVRPEVIFHLAAQPIVGYSFRHPVETMSINIMGTVNVLEAAKCSQSVRAIVVVTSDKCYENKEWVWGYRESDTLGGHDPYSASKACAELVTSSFRQSYFSEKGASGGCVIPGTATVRSGNVIGGGDWAEDRLVPDLMRALIESKTFEVRSPNSVRPWQHVLEPLRGYIQLAEKLLQYPLRFSEPWNFGPPEDQEKTVSEVVHLAQALWGGSTPPEKRKRSRYKETKYLKLDASKARSRLAWRPVLDFESSIRWTVDWYRKFREGHDMREFTESQVDAYVEICQQQTA